VEGLAGHQCTQIAAAKDHTVVLTEDGYVYTFGLNTFHQLGILPPPANCSVPRQVKNNISQSLVVCLFVFFSQEVKCEDCGNNF